MKLFHKIVANTVFSLNILILFLLIFRDQLIFPAWVQMLGRMHPLLLHIPIGILILVVLLTLFQKYFVAEATNSIVLFTLYLAALTSALTALMGLVLSGEGGYSEDLLTGHLISGVATSLLTWTLLLITFHYPEQKKLFYTFLTISVLCLTFAGHLGASLTHGENYVFQPLSQNEETVLIITDSTSLYEAAIYPVFNSKCVSCHNEKKAKGELIMTSIEKFTIGGENGAPWQSGEPDKSLLIKRILLPDEHDDHMPPIGKPQLTEDEINLLHQWIQYGADTKTAWTKFTAQDSLRTLAVKFIQQNQKATETSSLYAFDFASSATIERLNTPFLTVSQFSRSEPALKADFFLREAFDKKKLEELSSVKDQLVTLNLFNMPVTDDDCKVIAQFKNLEKLNLNNTSISGKDFSFLKGLEKLKSLSITGTQAEFESVKTFSSLPELKEVFIWNTKLSSSDIEHLKKEFPDVRWNTGFVPEEKEILRLTPPILVNENPVLEKDETIRLKNNLPGTIIRYTLDGEDPDSITSEIYKEPIPINGFVKLKARAYKESWNSSRVFQQVLFKKGFKPDSAKLTNQPNKDYKGEGITTLIDNKKGSADNYRDIAWLGYREQPFIGSFDFNTAPTITNITISYALNVPGYLLPPASIEVWGGNDKNLILIQKITPKQPDKNEGVRIEVIQIPVGENKFKHYKVIVNPVAKLPAWHPGKGQKGWIFMDEIFFN
jgi:hypothetical protein